MGRPSRLRRAARWAASLGEAAKVRPRALLPALADLGKLFATGGVGLRCPAPRGGGMRATFALDGCAFVRITGVDDVLAAGAAEALRRFGERLAAARQTLAALRAALDALVALLALSAAVLAAFAGGGGWGSPLRFALVSAAYAALVPLRAALLRLTLRVLMRAAIRRAGG